MFTIHSLMLVSLGFLLAVLLGFIIAPAYWARAVRLTTERIRRSIPMTEAEIRAQLDRLRAEHAVRVHRLETYSEKARLSAARQRVEINRRDATISGLERQAKELDTNLEASSNARRVLEQTIADRIPKIEARLLESRKLLEQRDAELGRIKDESSTTYQALDETMQISAQQRNEIDRLRSTLSTRAKADNTGPAAARFDTEIALRSELEELRARARDQASLIDRLQRPAASGRLADKARSGRDSDANKTDSSVVDATAGKASATIIRLDEVDNKSSEGSRTLATADSLNAEIETLKTANKRQADEIEKLNAALRVFENETGAAGKPSAVANLRDSKVSLRARLSSADKEIEQQAEAIKRLNAELAATNDRLAQQATRHREELRRLGSGTVPTSARPRGREGTFAETDQPEPSAGDKKRPSLASRIIEKLPETATELARANVGTSVGTGTVTASARTETAVKSQDSKKSTETKPAKSDNSSKKRDSKSATKASDSADKSFAGAGAGKSKEPDSVSDGKKAKPADTASEEKPGRSRLMDRIAGLSKS